MAFGRSYSNLVEPPVAVFSSCHATSYLIGAQSVNTVARKVEEIRRALWLEREMRERLGSKRRAKEEILARYVSLGRDARVVSTSIAKSGGRRCQKRSM